MIIPTIEKRICSRFKIPNARVKFKNSGFLSPLRFFSRSCVLINISKAGLGFMYKKKLPYNCKIIIKVLIPKIKPLFLKGRVRWQEQKKRGTYTSIGVEFVPFGKSIGCNSLDALQILRDLETQYAEEQITPSAMLR
ncbi:MAG: PilZ domain-containing protein [bacterium]